MLRDSPTSLARWRELFVVWWFHRNFEWGSVSGSPARSCFSSRDRDTKPLSNRPPLLLSSPRSSHEPMANLLGVRHESLCDFLLDVVLSLCVRVQDVPRVAVCSRIGVLTKWPVGCRVAPCSPYS